MSISYEIEAISPLLAADLLQTSAPASATEKKQIEAYALDMRNGKWKMNGEPIIISSLGRVLSGKLRLRACVAAANDFAALVVRGVNEADFETIDALRRRTVADILTIRNEQSGRALAASLAFLWRFSRQDHYKPSLKVPTQALLSILNNNPEVRDSLIHARVASPVLPLGIGGALHFLLTTHDPALANQFFLDIARGIDGEEPKTAGMTLGKSLQVTHSEGGRRNGEYMLAIFTKAWNAYVEGRNIMQLRWAPNEERPELSKVRLSGMVTGKTAVQLSDIQQEANANLDLIEVELVDLTPEEAGKLLEMNTGNRRISQPVVDKYARDIKNGSWKLNGQTIKIGKSGRLLDGQHRCAAVHLAKRPIKTLIIRNLEEGVFDTFDLGQRKALSEVLKERGEQNTATLAAVLRQVWMIDNGYIQLRDVLPTNGELIKLLETHPNVRQSVGIGHKIRDVIATSIGCSLHHVFGRISAGKSNSFFDALGSGANLTSESPVLKLRNLLLKSRDSRRRSMSISETYALSIKAWNAYYTGAAVGSLKWQNGTFNKEEFPEIIDFDNGNNRIGAVA